MAPALSTAALIEDDPWDMPELLDTGVKWRGMLNVKLAVILSDSPNTLLYTCFVFLFIKPVLHHIISKAFKV